MEVKSIDDLHDQIDYLVLGVFESMRNESGATPSVEADAKLIATRYGEACQSIDNLIGINKIESEQLKELGDLSSQYEASKLRTLELQATLLLLKAKIDAGLEE